MKYKIPRHGCARCVWWRYKSTDGFGRCAIFAKDTWFQRAPCPEYEMDAEAEEEIEVILES